MRSGRRRVERNEGRDSPMNYGIPVLGEIKWLLFISLYKCRFTLPGALRPQHKKHIYTERKPRKPAYFFLGAVFLAAVFFFGADFLIDFLGAAAFFATLGAGASTTGLAGEVAGCMHARVSTNVRTNQARCMLRRLYARIRHDVRMFESMRSNASQLICWERSMKAHITYVLL